MSRRTRRADQQQAPAPHSTTVSNNPIFFVHDGLDDLPGAAAAAKPLPLPLPPSRAHPPAGSRRAAASPFVTSQRGGGWVLRRVHHDDPFLAAYVACTKNGDGKVDAAVPAKRQQEKGKGRDDGVQGCGIWSGWAAAGAKYAGAMSCKYGCDVATVHVQGGDPAASPAPRLHLSRQLVVIPARKRALQARGRPQG